MKVKDFLYFISSNTSSFGTSDPWLITKCLMQEREKKKKKKTKRLSLEIPRMETRVWVSKTAHTHLIWYLILVPLSTGFKWEHLIPYRRSRSQLWKTCSGHILVPLWVSAVLLAAAPSLGGFDSAVLLTLTKGPIQIASAGIASSGIRPFTYYQ